MQLDSAEGTQLALYSPVSATNMTERMEGDVAASQWTRVRFTPISSDTAEHREHPVKSVPLHVH